MTGLLPRGRPRKDRIVLAEHGSMAAAFDPLMWLTPAGMAGAAKQDRIDALCSVLVAEVSGPGAAEWWRGV